VTDTITLTIPRQRPFHSVAHLVLGGLAVRRNLTLEHLEDLQVALDELLDEGDGEVTVELQVQPDAIETTIGPFGGGLRAELDRERGDGTPALSRVLGTVVDEFEVVERGGGHWIELRKAVHEPETAGEV
jgi:anti-sigma regulatory factor (Ser/Thr protein kinase)